MEILFSVDHIEQHRFFEMNEKTLLTKRNDHENEQD